MLFESGIYVAISQKGRKESSRTENLHRFIIGLGVQVERVDEAFVFAQQETIVDVRDGLVGQGTLDELSPRSYEP